MVTVVPAGGEKYQVVSATLGPRVILDAPPVMVSVVETVCGANSVAAENLMIEPSVVAVRVAHCNWSANVTPSAWVLVISIALNDCPAEVMVWPAEPFKVTVEEPGVTAMPVRSIEPDTLTVPPRFRVFPVPVPAMDPVIVAPPLESVSRPVPQDDLPNCKVVQESD